MNSAQFLSAGICSVRPKRQDKSHEPTFGRAGRVFVHGRFAGTISESEDEFVYTYDDQYAADPALQPISVTFLKRIEPYRSKVLFPFFDGLIPEGWLLNVAEKNWKLDPRDRMGLLLTVCRDCIGAVHVESADITRIQAAKV